MIDNINFKICKIDYNNLNNFINKKIYIYAPFFIQDIFLQQVISVKKNMYTIRVDNWIDVIDLNNDEIILFETLENAKIKQALDVYLFYMGKLNISAPNLKSACDYYEKFISVDDMEFFILNITKYQMSESEYMFIIDNLLEKQPQYFI
jgi:hypothetical protein